jgi:hypothetical protein
VTEPATRVVTAASCTDCGKQLYGLTDEHEGVCSICRIKRANAVNAARPRPEHAPGHPYGVQAGPGGMYARWCLLDDCEWRDTTKPDTYGVGVAGAT